MRSWTYLSQFFLPTLNIRYKLSTEVCASYINSLVSQISKIRNLWIFGGKIDMTRQSLKAMNAPHYAAVTFTLDLQCWNANLPKILSYNLKLFEFISKISLQTEPLSKSVNKWGCYGNDERRTCLPFEGHKSAIMNWIKILLPSCIFGLCSTFQIPASNTVGSVAETRTVIQYVMVKISMLFYGI